MNRFLKGAMILTLAGIIVKIIGAFSKVLLARILGGEGIGLYQMAYPIYQIIVSLATAGLPVAISIMIADKLAYKDIRGASKIFRVSATVLFALGAFFSVALFLSVPWLVESEWLTDPRSSYALMALAPAIVVVTILSCPRFSGYVADRCFAGCGTIFARSLHGWLCAVLITVWFAYGSGRRDACDLSGRCGRRIGALVFLSPATPFTG